MKSKANGKASKRQKSTRKFTATQKRKIVKMVFGKNGRVKEYGIKRKIAAQEQISVSTIDSWKKFLKAA